MTQNATPGSMGSAPGGYDDASARVGAEDVVKAAGDPGIDIHLTIGSSNAMGASWGHEPVSPQRRCKAWVDDPWSAMTTGEAEAWRAGWEAAKAQAVTVARRAPIPEEASPAEAHGRLSGALISAEAIAAMDPPA